MSQTTDSAPGLSLESLVARVADEFVERQQRGEAPNVEEYVARYPEQATVLREVLAALQLVRRAGVSGSGGAAVGPSEEGGQTEGVVGTLGDFRLLREVGRGGMGIVYEAEKLAL